MARLPEEPSSSSSSVSKSLFNRSFTFHSNFRRAIAPGKLQLPVPDPPQKPHSSIWSQTAKKISDIGLFRRTFARSELFAGRLTSATTDGDRIVVYFTSLHSVRRTYEDCVAVRSIFRGFMVAVDERDVSMDASFRKELQAKLGPKPVTLPQVFIGSRHIGGAEEVRQLLESGELRKLLEGCPARDPGAVCRTCGDARFVPCSNCRGSRKVFSDIEGQLRRCQGCNENGLMRCPNCTCR